MSVVMSGEKVASQLIKEMDKDMTALSKDDITPSLGIVRAGEDPGSIAYENGLKKRLKELGMKVNTFSYPSDIGQEEFLTEFQKINDSDSIHGILVLRPLPEQLDTGEVSRRINPDKDVDGMSPTSLGKIMVDDQEGLLPGTPAGVMEILAFYDIEVEGKDVVIIGHSEVVGKPLNILLLNKNATVTVCHIYSKHTKEMASKADILISATGQAGMITADYLKEGAVVIDVGISRKDGKIYGDVKYDEASEKASYITPVPGGVGAVTTTMLAKNVIKATKLLSSEE